ncbi:NEAT domain-containing protein [Geomicrobium sp. JCM 19039]|uniref:NEAT domain-containing protein n=1 Tax=Geomicrobium sp. JCM 19039 TaxID=1460636 RepID=UPI00045F33B7|nr:NEAT domain-containing protein [Geomicrobium sp. JCM 19039]GAK11505.1 cell surface protein IsdA, transfers heme from hemoglobin to apo-IsdC [Geomicrobium sp. JCM 19039]
MKPIKSHRLQPSDDEDGNNDDPNNDGGNNGNDNNGNNGNNGNNNGGNNNNNNGNNDLPGDELVNGQYDINFVVLKDGTDQVSVMDDYTKKPATLYVQDGSYTVDLTLTNSTWYQDLTIEGSGPTVISEDSEADERVVRFAVDSLEERIDAWVHIIVTGIPGFNYDNEYDVQILFDPDSVNLVNTDGEIPQPNPSNGGSNNGGNQNNNQGNNTQNNHGNGNGVQTILTTMA